jgi:hypothetical protein
MAAALTRLTSGDDATNTNSSTTASITLSGAPVIIALGAAVTAAAMNYGTVTWNGGAQNFTQLSIGSADGTNDVMGRLMYLDAPTPGTNTITINHATTGTRRAWDVFEVSGHDTSSSSAWRDAAAAAVENGTAGTTHEITITSAVGDYPVAVTFLRNVSSSPTLSPNGASSAIVAGHLAGTTLRMGFLTGTGAASVTLGGTTSTSTQSVVLGFNVNAAGGQSNAPRSMYYALGGMR